MRNSRDGEPSVHYDPAMDGVRSELPAVAGLPVQRPPCPRTGAEVLRALGLDALVELLEGSTHGIGLTAQDRWTYVNAAGRRQLGRSFDELRGMDARSHTPSVPPLPVDDLAMVVLPTASAVAADPVDEELRQQLARSGAAQERLRLGRDLHDSVSSALFALHTRTQVVDRALATGDLALLTAAAEDMSVLSAQAIAELRAMVSAMREDAPPADDAPPDLKAALERLAATARRRDGMQVCLQVADDLPAVPPETAVHLDRIATEAVHNCRKHAGTDAVRVALDVRGSELVLVVADEGRGFDPAAAPGDGHGQRTMRERAVLCGGWLHVDAAPGRGTRVVARVPLPG